MLFCSLQYLVFFTGVFVIHWLLPWRQARVWLLLAASLFFYASWNEWLALVVGVSSVIDYLLARGMDRFSSHRVRKLLLFISLASNLGLLCYFKYANFFLQSLEAALHRAGGTASLPLLRVILPIGISFYTFEAINYTVDVYRRRIRAERNLAHFVLFITFFPHLVAGPIVRARDFLPQIARPKRWSWPRARLGAEYLILGLVKKLAVADRMAMMADPVFANPGSYGTAAIWLAALAYALQIYCDFSGYTDMALGSAHLLGYKLAINFDMPYSAANVSEFWRRWHISLSTWLRDYLFIPLGGSRGSEWQTTRNLMLTMILGGLWHGANWTFIVWGMVHGSLLVGHRAFRRWCGPRPALRSVLESVPGTAVRIAVTFLTVTFCWVLFRATTFEAAYVMFGRMLSWRAGLPGPLAGVSLWWTMAVMAVCHMVARNGGWRRVVSRTPSPVLGFGYAGALMIALTLAPEGAKGFIYFQF
ncbi:MBOAT family O-acyltransferase [Zavarzinella formosa]|uniref:MBOAT family O-acyltransferase n=1 Tax=Zavarzinella formosa TaxID=360055 RepID=UPI0002D411D0|nr:MBOAT family protein [Zavarzinella formosa]